MDMIFKQIDNEHIDIIWVQKWKETFFELNDFQFMFRYEGSPYYENEYIKFKRKTEVNFPEGHDIEIERTKEIKIGEIFTPGMNCGKASIQICGFEEELYLWGCANFKDKKDIQLLFSPTSNRETTRQEKEEIAKIVDGRFCLKCFREKQLYMST